MDGQVVTRPAGRRGFSYHDLLTSKSAVLSRRGGAEVVATAAWSQMQSRLVFAHALQVVP